MIPYDKNKRECQQVKCGHQRIIYKNKAQLGN